MNNIIKWDIVIWNIIKWRFDENYSNKIIQKDFMELAKFLDIQNKTQKEITGTDYEMIIHKIQKILKHYRNNTIPYNEKLSRFAINIINNVKVYCYLTTDREEYEKNYKNGMDLNISYEKCCEKGMHFIYKQIEI